MLPTVEGAIHSYLTLGCAASRAVHVLGCAASHAIHTLGCAASQTVLLYLSWQPRSGGELRVHDAPPGSGARDIAPLPGRLVVFFSQEVRHEVKVSEGERYAITQWIWEAQCDSHGR